MQQSMLDNLAAFYNEVGILSTNFNCQYYGQCAAGTAGLVKGKSAYVGSEYENHSIPRILFVSLDPGSGQDFETPQKRTPLGVRGVEENRDWQKLPKLLHWYTTHKLAVLIGQVFNPGLGYPDANHIFAHANCVKCCEIKKGHDMSRPVLYRNCKQYLSREMIILDPDIVIAQGDDAHKAVMFACEKAQVTSRIQPVLNVHERVGMLSINHHQALYLRTIYPSWRNDRTGKQERELYPFYLEAAKAFKHLL